MTTSCHGKKYDVVKTQHIRAQYQYIHNTFVHVKILCLNEENMSYFYWH